MIRAYDEYGNIVEDYEKQIYNKAVDDFVHKCDEYCGFYTLGNAILTRKDLLKIAKELKEQENENRN